MLTETLFETQPTHGMGLNEKRKTLQGLYNKETRLHLHAVSLSDYLRLKQIPRGLRMQKGPMIGQENDTFCQKWCEITNKCSFDLMVLTIEEISSQLVATRATIQNELDQLETESSVNLVELKQELDEYKSKLEKEIKERKMRKFQRDALDYQHNNVYKWRNKATQQETSQTDHYASTTDHETTSEASGSSVFFGVGYNQGDRDQHKKGRGRGRGKGSAGGRKGTTGKKVYWTRSSTTK